MTQLATTQPARPKLLEAMALRLGTDPRKLHDTLKATVFRDANDEEFHALLIVANEFQLNPLLKQIYAYKAKDGGGIVPVVSVDGWIKIINGKKDELDGLDFDDEDDEDGKPISKTCIMYVQGKSRPIRIKERYRECYRNTGPWNQMPHRMLRHKALIQCARVAFGLAGIYDPDEARDIREAAGRVMDDEPDQRVEKRPLFKPRFLPRPEEQEVEESVAEIASTAAAPGSYAERMAAKKGRKPALVLEGQTEEQLREENARLDAEIAEQEETGVRHD